MTFPQCLFVEITSECNLKCKLCKLWRLEDSEYRLSSEEKINFLKKLFGPSGNFQNRYDGKFSVILTGGEPFLYPEQVFTIADFCKLNNISCFVNTNGAIINQLVDNILDSGLTAISISLDSHISSVHNKLRGSQGLFNKIIKTIGKMLREKQKNDLPIKICVQSILGNWNINIIHQHLTYYKALDINGIMFQPLQYPFGCPIPDNWYEVFGEFPKSKNDIDMALDYLLKEKQKFGFIMNSREEIILWKSYFRNPEYIERKINPCKSFEQNLIVDVYGNVKFCFNDIPDPLNKIGNIRTTSLEEIWNGDAARKMKKRMESCNRACGIMACHIDANLRTE